MKRTRSPAVEQTGGVVRKRVKAAAAAKGGPNKKDVPRRGFPALVDHTTRLPFAVWHSNMDDNIVLVMMKLIIPNFL